MKTRLSANDNDFGSRIAHTRQVWQPRADRALTDEDAREIHQNVVGFFGVLSEWSRTELPAPANDNSAPDVSKDGEVRHDS